MNPLDELLALRQICELKARYFRCLDTKDWEGFAAVLTADATLRNIETEVTGRHEIVRYVKERLDGAVSVHHGNTPEITVDDKSAQGIWAMTDYVERSDGSGFRGYGHYYEKYRHDDQWRIFECHLIRLRVDFF